MAIRTGAIFGIVEAITPLIGRAAASQYVSAVDHWIAFGLHGAVDLNLVLQVWFRHEDDGPVDGSVGRTIPPPSARRSTR